MSYIPAKKNTAYVFYTALRNRTSGQLQVNPTLAEGDVQVSIDGGAFTNLDTLPVVTPAGGVAVKASLAAVEMNGDNIQVLFSDAAGAEWDDLLVSLQTAAKQFEDIPISVGAVEVVYPVTSSVDGAPIADVLVWVTSDAAGAHVLDTGRTDQYGNITFHLDPGTVYFWRKKVGWNFTDPDVEIVT